MMPAPIDPTKLKDRLFKIKKLHYNTYDIQHPKIKGQFRVITIPQNFLQVPKEMAPPQATGPLMAIGSQTIVAFTNLGEKLKPTDTVLTPQMVATEEKEDLTRFYENANEPWNEFVLQGTPPLVVRVKTVLTRVEWLKKHVNAQGDPVIWGYTNVSVDVFEEKTPEGGLP